MNKYKDAGTTVVMVYWWIKIQNMKIKINN